MLPHEDQLQQAAQQLGLKFPVRVVPTYNKRGGYAGLSRDPFTGQQSHLIHVNPEQHGGAKNWALWHELGHAQRVEQGGVFEPNDQQSDEEYWGSPNEQHAEGVANQYADTDLWATASPYKNTQLRKFVYNGDTGQLLLGDLGAEEGEQPSHAQLAQQIDGADISGTVTNGWVTFEGPVLKRSELNQWKVRHHAQEALKDQLGDEYQGVIGGEQENLWEMEFTGHN
jgi:hypothetical protein